MEKRILVVLPITKKKARAQFNTFKKNNGVTMMDSNAQVLVWQDYLMLTKIILRYLIKLVKLNYSCKHHSFSC